MYRDPTSKSTDPVSKITEIRMFSSKHLAGPGISKLSEREQRNRSAPGARIRRKPGLGTYIDIHAFRLAARAWVVPCSAEWRWSAAETSTQETTYLRA